MSDDLTTLRTKLTSALMGLDNRQSQATPAHNPDKWSIQQIVEHLLLTYRATAEAFEIRLAKKTATRAPLTIPHRLGQLQVVHLGVFPRGRKAPEQVSPSLPAILQSGDELCERVNPALDRLVEMSRQANALFGSGRAVSHMILGPMSVQQWGRFHLVHGLHHIKQIRGIRKDHAF